MPVFRSRIVLRAVAALSLLSVTFAAFGDDREDFFERQIRPLLIENCVACHGPEKQEGSLRLDSREQILVGSDDTDALVNTQEVQASRLLQVLMYAEDDVQMPPKAKLSDQQISAVRTWITQGAVWPKNNSFGKATPVDVEGWKKHWAFQPITDPEMPPVYQDRWHPIDAFIRQKLTDKQIKESAPADGRTLVRRASFALVGLPPALEDLAAAEAIADTPTLFRWLDDYTDRLLATPQFGERWARYWLDIARYADTKGYVFQENREYKDAWRYREWVIRSLNDDMPYDEFLRRQIAADQLPGSDDPAELAAMGFFTLGRRFHNNKHDIIDDRIDVLSRGTMALTVSCARCHDHKFDPIPTTDYYSLYGVFDSSKEPKNAPSSLRLVDLEKPREPYVFVRGAAGNRGQRVTRHFLTALSSGEPKPFTHGSGRLELASRIASKDNPLTARVAVNRIWLRMFGTGLVESPSDFGVRTPPPSHPELLDHLASYLIKNNWSRKAVIRYIAVSYTWRQSSQWRADIVSEDPENRLFARMSRQRLNFEAFRDSVLSAADNLDASVGGESVDILKTPFTNRRTVYARIDRQNLPGTFRTFDFASPDTLSASRFETTVPQQALFQLNNPFVIQQAEQIVERSSASDNVGKIQDLYLSILRRSPKPDELSQAKRFLHLAAQASTNKDQVSGWQYGWGEINAERNQVMSFQSFPGFYKDRFSGGTKHPDEKLGWTMLTRDGGHTGHDRRHCPIRRWVAQQDCTLQIGGILKHNSKHGDGIAGHVVFNSRSLSTTAVHNGSAKFSTDTVEIKAGEFVDFVADCRENESHDTFLWQVQILESKKGQQTRTWRSNQDFPDRAPSAPLSPQAQLAQTLMLTNEFMFVD